MLEREKSIIIISTTISICIMLLSGIDNNQEKKEVNKQGSTKNEIQITIDKSKDVSTTSKTHLDEKKAIIASENKEESIVTKEPGKPIEEKNNIESTKAPENSNKNESPALQVPEENLKKDEDTEKTAAVFKVNREDIYGGLSLLDKEKLFLISTKLKASDYKKIYDLLQVDVDGTGTLSALKILKERLSKNDYSKIKQIFNKFINMDLVDN